MGRTSQFTESQRASLIRQHAGGDSREMILESMTPALRGKLNELQKSVGDRMINNLEYYWRLGGKIVEIQDNPEAYLTPEQRAAKANPIVMLEYVLNTSTADVMRRAAIFNERYTREDFDALIALRCEDEEHPEWRSSWGHVIHLLSIPDRRLRLRLEKQMAEEGLSPQALHTIIKAHHGGPRRSGGRPLAIPKTIKGQFAQVLETSRIWFDRCNKVWLGEQNNIYKNLLAAPPETYTPEVVQGLISVEEAMDDVIAAAMKQKEEANKTLVKIRKTISSTNGHPVEEPAERTQPSRKKSAQIAIQRAKHAAAS